MSTFVDPFTDTGFKMIFGKENKSNGILMSFLNALFADQPDFERITELHYINNERNREWKEDRLILYDIVCRTESGRRFIVEMQRQSQPNFLARAVYYVARGIYEQGLHSAGDSRWKYEILPVVGVFLCDFHVRGLEHNLVEHISLYNTTAHKPAADLMRCAFIQLPEFKKHESECTSEFDQWIYILKHMDTMTSMPFTSHSDVFERLAKVSNVAAMGPDERARYEYDLKKARDYRAELQQAIDTGLKKGIKKGKTEIARNLLRMGMGIDQVAAATGLTTQELQGLA